MNKGFWVIYDNRGSIGRRYARVDEIGVPLAVAIDYDTKNDDVLTIRNRDSWEQVSLKIDDLPLALELFFKGEKNFIDLGKSYF